MVLFFTLLGDSSSLDIQDWLLGEEDDAGDDRYVFLFDGGNERYTEFVGAAEEESEFSAIEEWGYKWVNSNDTWEEERLLSLGTWIKPEENPSGLNRIMQFKFGHHFELSINGSHLELKVVEQSGSGKVYTFPSVEVAMNEWLFILIIVHPTNKSLDSYPPVVYVKGLNRSPVQELQPQVSELGDLEEENAMSIILRLGQGFKGRIAPVQIATHGSASYYNYQSYINCVTLRDHRNYQCTRSSHDSLTEAKQVTNYKHSPNSNIQLLPYQEINIEFDVNFQCEDLQMLLAIKSSLFNLPEPIRKTDSYGGLKYEYYRVNVTLGQLESGCNLIHMTVKEDYYSRDDYYLLLYRNLTECGFEKQVDGEQIVYRNSVYGHTNNRTSKLMDVSCRYTPPPVKKEEVRVMAYVMQEVFSVETQHTFTPWPLSLHLYSDSSYSQELDYPVKLENAGENIYVEAKVETNVEGVELRIESCRTHITLNELDELQRVLIKDYEKVSPSVKILNTDSTTRKRFKFKADKFEDYPRAVVNLSCVLRAAKDGADATTTEKVTKKGRKKNKKKKSENS